MNNPTVLPGQASIFDELDAHDDDTAWWAQAWAAAEAEAASGRVFAAYDLCTRHGVPDPESVNRWGALFTKLRAAGVIDRYDYAPSGRPTVRGSAASRWRGTYRYRTAAGTTTGDAA
ncbi:hypothetical protein SMC26_40430 [Actinomadura fulvescens]|uniref:Uncharacterized protein n=1 Tax=Actinomadura fulvescens TaxID=46160 RepID=A0ABP6CJU3_9ACTN